MTPTCFPAMVEIIEAAGLPARGFARGKAMLAELDRNGTA